MRDGEEVVESLRRVMMRWVQGSTRSEGPSAYWEVVRAGLYLLIEMCSSCIEMVLLMHRL